MFYCPTNFAFHRLFPNAGSKIITELSSLEDSPCLERDKLSNRRFQYRIFRRNGNNNRQLSFCRQSGRQHHLAILFSQKFSRIHRQGSTHDTVPSPLGHQRHWHSLPGWMAA
jgi:hypothetical protein